MPSAGLLFVLPLDTGCLRWILESNANGLIDRDHLDEYVHGAFEWKIGLYEDGIDYCTSFSGYKYGIENLSTMARKKRPD